MARGGESTVPLKMLLFWFHGGANTIIVSFLPLYLQYSGVRWNGDWLGNGDRSFYRNIFTTILGLYE